MQIRSSTDMTNQIKFQLSAIVTLLFIFLQIQGKAQVQEDLSILFEKYDSDKIKVMVWLKTDESRTAEIISITTQQNMSLHEKRLAVLPILKRRNQSERDSIKLFIDLFNKSQNAKAEIFEEFYVVPMLCIELTYDLASELIQHPYVSHVEDYYRYQIVPVSPVQKIDAPNIKSIGGHEPGHDAIKAPFMWALGYTGLGTKAYIVDTGVWPVHPSISRQWMGNYRPQNQVWRGFDSTEPQDKPGAHGTHVTGTVLGLDLETNDTIGVAFNANYIASDPIVEDLSLVKPLPIILSSFEFALNPDGDENTTDDVPDIICNSWGIGDSLDIELCTVPYIRDLFTALDAMGIGVEFSAGNEGPGPMTIGLPNYVAIDSINIFAVGALNGNVEGFPIAAFSSRGPIPCDVSGDLQIKPEVSAPGVNIRSSVQKEGFALYSGTSMAGPHVTGAVLLLKEAFPQLTGKEILRALYLSADDLGEPGEDNTYGMGIINLENAYNFLSNLYTPTPPNTSPFDLAIYSANNSVYKCSPSGSLTVRLHNEGSIPINGGFVELFKNNQSITSQIFSESILPGQDVFVELSNIPFDIGKSEFVVVATPDEDFIERTTINNSRVFNITRLSQSTFPFADGFEAFNLGESGYTIENDDFLRTWDTTSTQGLSNSLKSAVMPFQNYNPRASQKDFLISPVIAIPSGLSELKLRFDLAYRFRGNIFNDSLHVSISTDCGATFSSPVYSTGGASMSTLDSTWLNFRPMYASHWRDVEINLNTFSGAESLIFRFTGTNKGGTNLYIDNIALYSTSNPILTQSLEQARFEIYPNPVNDVLVIKSKFGNGDLRFEILDVSGRIVSSGEVNGQNTIEVGMLRPGIYFIRAAQQAVRFVKL